MRHPVDSLASISRCQVTVPVAEGLHVELRVEHVLYHAAEPHHLTVAQLVHLSGVERGERGHRRFGGQPRLEKLRDALLPLVVSGRVDLGDVGPGRDFPVVGDWHVAVAAARRREEASDGVGGERGGVHRGH